ncbi:MAG: ABC transporter transmembrane domain-containing protein, partial [Planctomycetota bacterium]
MPDDETPEKSVLEVLRRFMTEYVSHHKGLFAMVQVLHALTVLLMLAPPLLIRYIFDTALENEDYTMLAVCSGGIVVTFALWTLVVVAKNYWGHDIAQRTTSWLRNDLYQHLQSLSMSFHDEKKSGELLSRLVDDLNVVQEASYHIPEAVVEATVLITGASVLMFYLNWKLALASLVMMPFLVVFSRYVSVRMWRGFRRVRSQKAKLADELEENLGGIQIIKAFCGEPREAEEVERQNRAHYNTRMDVIKWVSLLYPGAMFLNNTALAIAIFYGGVLVIEGEVLVGTIFAFL